MRLDCLDQLKQLLFADVSNFDTSGSSVDINEERDTQLDIWFDSDAFLKDLHIAPFNVMEVFDDVNDKLFAFESLYLDI